MNDGPILNAFQHLQEDVAATVSTEERLMAIDRRRSPTRLAVVAALGAAGVAAVVIAAVALPSMLPSDPDLVTPATEAPTSPTTTTVSGVDTDVPVLPASKPAWNHILTAVLVTDGTAKVTALNSRDANGDFGSTAPYPITFDEAYAPIDRVAGDRQGGLVFQRSAAIWHLAVGDDAPVYVTSASEMTAGRAATEIRLEDTYVDARLPFEDRSPFVITVTTAGLEGDRVEEVRVHSLDTGSATLIHTINAYEAAITRAAASDRGTIVLTLHAEGESWFEFIDYDGNPIEIPHNPKPSGGTAEPFVDQAALSASGEILAYLESDTIGHRFDGSQVVTLVVLDLVSGEELRRVELPAGEYAYMRADTDGGAVVLSRFEMTDDGPAPTAVLWFPHYSTEPWESDVIGIGSMT